MLETLLYFGILIYISFPMEKVLNRGGKVFSFLYNSTFQSLENEFQSLENKFHDLENRFQGLGNTFLLGGGIFSIAM
jgi:hypothetical protein